MTAIESAVNDMSHRERVASMTLLSMALTFGPYLLLVASRRSGGGMADLEMLSWFGVAAVSQVILLGAGNLTLRRRFPEEARAPADERDLAIERRSIRSAYFVLITGMILVGVVMPFSASCWSIVNAAIAAIFVAEMVHHGVAVRSYRRGWRG